MPKGARIDEKRFRRDFESLAQIGSTGDGGVHRPSLGRHHLAARRWFRERIEEAGLELRVDGAGNHSAVLASAAPDARTVLLGSHLDSVPQGGRFDGALGVVAALEILRTVAGAGIETGHHLEAIDFTDEEGTLVGLLGSRALAGTLPAEELSRPRCGRKLLEEALKRAELDDEGILGARRDPDSLEAFLELHIEQGPRLMEGRMSVGIVSGIVGIGSLVLELSGRADHAGTVPMGLRRDAGLGAARLIVDATELVTRSFPGCVANFGRIDLRPGAFNIVPGAAELTVEFRAPDDELLAALQAALEELFLATAERHELELELRPQALIPAAPCAPRIQDAFVAASGKLDLRQVSLTSGAGHDTGALSAVCPSGMIFIPSRGGSHSPREEADWQACVDGANVLLLAALDIAAA